MRMQINGELFLSGVKKKEIVPTSSIVMVGVETHTRILASCVPTLPGLEHVARPCLKTTLDSELSACLQISPPLHCLRFPKLTESLPCEYVSPRMWEWPDTESPLFDCNDQEDT